jgi:hypothetical protein
MFIKALILALFISTSAQADFFDAVGGWLNGAAACTAVPAQFPMSLNTLA